MEIFIVGVIIVALMVYASTRIKRSAASAFERETIDREEFYLIKPEGFLNPIDDESKFAFYAYSKEFGTEDKAEEMRRAEIFIKTFADKTFKQVCAKIKSEAENIVSNEENIGLIKAEKTIREVEVSEFYKIAESTNTPKVFELKISVLKDFEDDYQERVDEILESFRVK